VPVEMEVANQGDILILLQQFFVNKWHGPRGIVRIDGDAHQFRAGARERDDLTGSRGHIGGIGIGHGLHHHRGTAANGYPAHAHGVAAADSGARSDRGHGQRGDVA
jgi:hypothetical protein